MSIIGLDHVQIAAPSGCESDAGDYFAGLLGLAPIEKPEVLAERGGAWFQVGPQQIHVGVAGDFDPASKAHPALRVVAEELDRVAATLGRAGYPVAWDEAIPGLRRFYSQDPWGNRIEFVAGPDDG